MGSQIWKWRGYMRGILALRDGNFLLWILRLARKTRVLRGTTHLRPAIKLESSRGGQDYWILKIDPQGTRIWDRRFGSGNEDICTSALENPDGTILLAGSSLSGQSGDKTARKIGLHDFWLVLTDRDGKKLRDESFGEKMMIFSIKL